MKAVPPAARHACREACELQHKAGRDGQKEGGDELGECGFGEGGMVVLIPCVHSEVPPSSSMPLQLPP